MPHLTYGRGPTLSACTFWIFVFGLSWIADEAAVPMQAWHEAAAPEYKAQRGTGPLRHQLEVIAVLQGSSLLHDHGPVQRDMESKIDLWTLKNAGRRDLAGNASFGHMIE
jgi:hypothetical protein